MKLNSIFHADKFSLLLLGVSFGLFSSAQSACAQTQSSIETEFAVRSPLSIPVKSNGNGSSCSCSNHEAFTPPIVVVPPIVKPESVIRFPKRQTKNDSQSIRVDSDAFKRCSSKQVIACQPGLKQPQASKVPANLHALQPIKPSRPAFKTALQPLDANSHSEPILAAIRAPMDIAAATTFAKTASASEPSRIDPNDLLQPLQASASDIDWAEEEFTEPVNLSKAPKYDIQTPLPTGPIALFVDGPNQLRVNQVGKYEIAIANSSSDPTYVSGVTLKVPRGAEIVSVQGDAEINKRARTLTWSIDDLASGEQERFQFRVKMHSVCEVDFPVTISHDGRDTQTVRQATIVR